MFEVKDGLYVDDNNSDMQSKLVGNALTIGGAPSAGSSAVTEISPKKIVAFNGSQSGVDVMTIDPTQSVAIELRRTGQSGLSTLSVGVSSITSDMNGSRLFRLQDVTSGNAHLPELGLTKYESGSNSADVFVASPLAATITQTSGGQVNYSTMNSSGFVANTSIGQMVTSAMPGEIKMYRFTGDYEASYGLSNLKLVNGHYTEDDVSKDDKVIGLDGYYDMNNGADGNRVYSTIHGNPRWCLQSVKSIYGGDTNYNASLNLFDVCKDEDDYYTTEYTLSLTTRTLSNDGNFTIQPSGSLNLNSMSGHLSAISSGNVTITSMSGSLTATGFSEATLQSLQGVTYIKGYGPIRMSSNQAGLEFIGPGSIRLESSGGTITESSPGPITLMSSGGSIIADAYGAITLGAKAGNASLYSSSGVVSIQSSAATNISSLYDSVTMTGFVNTTINAITGNITLGTGMSSGENVSVISPTFNCSANLVMTGPFSFTMNGKTFNGIISSADTTSSWEDDKIVTAAMIKNYVDSQPGGGGMANPMTSAGDLIVGGTGGTPARLGIGSVGQILKVGSNGIEWANESGGGVIQSVSDTNSIDLTIDQYGDLTADIKLDWNNPGNVHLSTTSDGLKAEADIPVNSITGYNGIEVSNDSNYDYYVSLAISDKADNILTVINDGINDGVYVPPSPLDGLITSAGDLIVGNSSGEPSRLAKGTKYETLSIDVNGAVGWYGPEVVLGLQEEIKSGQIFYTEFVDTNAKAGQGYELKLKKLNAGNAGQHLELVESTYMGGMMTQNVPAWVDEPETSQENFSIFMSSKKENLTSNPNRIYTTKVISHKTVKRTKFGFYHCTGQQGRVQMAVYNELGVLIGETGFQTFASAPNEQMVWFDAITPFTMEAGEEYWFAFWCGPSAGEYNVSLTVLEYDHTQAFDQNIIGSCSHIAQSSGLPSTMPSMQYETVAVHMAVK